MHISSASSPLPLDYPNTTALITGASRGIGAEIARELARRGAPVLILTARTRSDLDTLAAELRDRYQTRVETIVADLADPAAAHSLFAETEHLGLAVDLLVNNAGFGDHGAFDTRPLPKQTAIVAVNVDSLVALTGLYLPPMVARGSGAILNIASTASFQPVPYMATYGATKAFVLSFSEALWAENLDRGTNIRVVCLCPGSTDTNFGAVATEGAPGGRGPFEQVPAVPPANVARAGLDALDRNANFAIPGTLNYIGSLGSRLLPRSTLARVAALLFRPARQPASPTNTATLRRAAIAGAALAASLTAAAIVAIQLRRHSQS